MIKNYKELSTTSIKRDALDILTTGVNSVLPKNIFNRVSFEHRILTVGKDKHDLSKGKVFVIGGGKACGLMALEIEKIIPLNLISGGIVNSVNKVHTKKITVRKCTFPIPDDYTLRGVKSMLKMVQNLNKNDTVLCLISGGGSALLPYPADGITLKEKQSVIELMLRRGVRSFEFHHLRKHISKIKGGQLARLLQPAKVITIILSDVINPKDDSPAAGPTYPDKSTFLDALKVLKRYNMLGCVPKSVSGRIIKGFKGLIAETPKPGEKFFNNVYNYVLGDYKLALKSMYLKAKQLGYNAKILPNPMIGEINNISGKIFEILGKRIKKTKGPSALIFSTESVVNLNGTGKGGRNQQLAGNLIKKLKEIPDTVYAGIDTDGRDYVKGVGGAIVDSSTIDQAIKKGININDYLVKNNTYELHKALSSCILMNDTGTKIGDINVFLHK